MFSPQGGWHLQSSGAPRACIRIARIVSKLDPAGIAYQFLCQLCWRLAADIKRALAEEPGNAGVRTLYKQYKQKVCQNPSMTAVLPDCWSGNSVRPVQAARAEGVLLLPHMTGSEAGCHAMLHLDVFEVCISAVGVRWRSNTFRA